MRDPYAVLGVSKTATQKEIKTEYRKLAKKYHPDTNPGDEKVAEKFKEISAAYNIVGDEKQRARFDRGEIDANGQEQAPFGFGGGGARQGSANAGGGFGGFHHGGGGAEDIFSEIFGNFRRGGAGGRPRATKGRDKTFAITVSFKEAAVGAKRRLTLGEGGKTLDVKIPAGIEDGKQIRLKGQGEAGSGGGASGDILINVTVKSDPLFVRDGKNIIVELPISLPEAVLGGTVQVPTVDGAVNMKIPAGSNTGTTLRMKGKGIAGKSADDRGDQMVKLKVVLPENQDEELHDWVSNWSKDHQYDARAKFAKGK
ncbi:DnaJ domain-containing protein [Sneathiella sp. P13V-1]|uniref:DnaJ C-terminal domain-containing protein n=1 Tax=Sneathiella sp. P13V-1 TaxID=2697366 RepID=UPI00187B621E|nr:DnaJ C-terminal domain-containing protein [Sneathiella sp. P13V-1]MBE7638400.1 DnaJ domain-containing protein [Sneathiella sp. P13V-1]